MTKPKIINTDFRSLCEDLIAEIDHKAWGVTSPPSSDALIARARAALAVEAVGPSDEELLELVSWSGHAFASDLVGYARAVLARYGSATRPIPVAERLPGAEDCAPWPDDPDASPWCWVGMDVDGGWVWEQRSAGVLTLFCDDFTHWLPAHALPIPKENTDD